MRPFPIQEDRYINRSAGIRIRCSKQALEVYKQLCIRSNNTNHWASMIVKGIKGLRTGMINSNDVFVNTTPTRISGVESFIVVLPGCTVIAEKHSNGEYYLKQIKASLDYFEKQANSEKPSLFRAAKINNKWEAIHIPDGKPTDNIGVNAVVAISDTEYEDPSRAAKIISGRISSTENKKVDQTGFDLFHTPGISRVGGLFCYQEALTAKTSKTLHEPAYLLADVMEKSQNIPDITWFSDFGGVGILTQAMQIVKNKNIKLESHNLYMYRPTTREDIAYQLSQDLGMKVDRDFITSNHTNINEFFGGASLTLPIQRMKREEDYGFLKAIADY